MQKKLSLKTSFSFFQLHDGKPSELSIFPKLNLIAWLAETLLSILPETADIGETLAAHFAGDCAAKNTVTTPTTTPLISPTGLI